MKNQRCCASDPLIKIELEEELKKQLEETPDEECLRNISRILYSLSHPLRLAIMRKNGVVDSYMKSKWKFYRINESAVCVLKGINKL